MITYSSYVSFQGPRS